MPFPLEIISIVASLLLDDPSSLTCLCQTNRTIYHWVIPIIYKNVSIATSESLRAFCTTINAPTSKFGTHTWILRLASVNLTFTRALAYKFRKTLRLMPNLQGLFLDITFETFNQCFHDHRCFNDLHAPFALQKLRISARWHPDFKDFISSQPSITELQLRFASVHEDHFVMNFITTRPDVLPNLSSVSATLGMLQGVVRGRPVTEVMISLDNWQQHEANVVVSDSWWESLYSASTVPITTTGIYSWEYSVDPWDQWVPAMRKLKVELYLRKLRIIEIFGRSDMDDAKERTLTRRVEQLITLGDFAQLKTVEVGLWHYGSWLSKDQVLGWLGDMSGIAAWKKHIPSLNQVTIYGVDLV